MPFTCPCCGRVSHNPEDAAHGYCGACHWFTADPDFAVQHDPETCKARKEAAARVHALDAWVSGQLAAFAPLGTADLLVLAAILGYNVSAEAKPDKTDAE